MNCRLSFLLIVALCLILGHSGCSTELDLNAPFVETPLMFGLLDIAEDTHYVRLNRTFLREGESALLTALDPEEIYYSASMQVRIEEFNNGIYVTAYPMTLVNGDTLGLPKESGIFAQVPNLLYRYIGQLNPDLSYKVVGEDNVNGIFVAAETDVLEDFDIVRPTPNPTLTSSLSFAGLADYQVRWENSPGAKVYQMHMRFYMRETLSSDINMVLKDTVLEWTVFNQEVVNNPNSSQAIDFDVSRSGFYSFLRQSVQPASGIVRFIDSVDFLFYAGDEELYSFILFNSAQLGITVDQITANYTNVEGGLGLLASRHRKATPKYKLNNQTLDSIACGSLTGGLNFAASGDSPLYPFCP